MNLWEQLNYDPNDQKHVAGAWKKLQEQIKRDEGKLQDDAREDKYDELASRGFSASAIEIPQVGSDGEYSPGTGTGSGYEEPSDLERWKTQINGLIESGNPTLQKAGLEMISNYQQRKTQKPSAPLVSMGEKYVPAASFVVDAEGKPVNVPVGTTFEEAKAQGWMFGQDPTAEQAKQAAAIDTSLGGLERLRVLMEEQGADLSGIGGLITEFRSGGTFGGAMVNQLLSLVGNNPSPADVEALSVAAGLSNQILQAYRGAQVGPKEQILFNRQLPIPGQPKATFEANRKRSAENLASLQKLISAGQGFIGSPLYKKMNKEDPGASKEMAKFETESKAPKGWTEAE